MALAQTHSHLMPIEKRSIFLILIGTFLEYFDLVLYVHLAVILNPLFFPTTNPLVAGLFGVLTFSSAYLLRPLGSFVFGYIGDKMGRKASIVWTSLLMGLASLTMGCLPSYEILGFTASVVFILARALQGFSSIGEIVGAQVFVAEVSEKTPYVHFLGVLPSAMMALGSAVALGSGMLCLRMDPINGWRWPFLMGAFVAIVGGIIRTKAIESPAFTALKDKKSHPTEKETLTFLQTLQFRKRNYWYYFGMEITTPMAFYFSYRYCSELLKGMGLSPADVILHNFPIGVMQLLGILGLGALTLAFDPLKILKTRAIIGFLLIPFLFWTLSTAQTASSIFIVQLSVALFWGLSICPALIKIVHSFPIIGRCVNLGSAYAISHAMMYVVTSYGIFSLDRAFGIWGVGSLFMVTTLISLVCIYRFQMLEFGSNGTQGSTQGLTQGFAKI